MKTIPLITIVIPAYNYGFCILNALESIRAQEDPHLETIVIDDGSMDDTADVIQSFQMTNPSFHLRYQYQENKGASNARNAGVRLAKGEYILMLDADDYLLPNALASFRRAICQYPKADVIMGGHISSDQQRKIKKYPFKKRLTHSHMTNFLYYLRKKISLIPGAILYRKNVFTLISYPETVKNAEDQSVFYQILATQTCISIKELVVMQNKHSDSLRHHFVFHQNAGLDIVDLVFDKKILPKAFFKYRKEYMSSRYLSLARIAFQHKAMTDVVNYYEQAIKVFPRHLFKVNYLKKYIIARLLSPYRLRTSQ